MKVIAYVPARLRSTRLPGKVLHLLEDKPLVQWAYEAALTSGLFDQVVVAVDDPRVEKVAQAFGAKTIMTSSNASSGTKRIIEALSLGGPSGEIIVNLQADEPFVSRSMFEKLLQGIHRAQGSVIWTLKTKIHHPEEKHSSDVVKVVTDDHARALYFSRSPIPFDRDSQGAALYRHIGLYAYTRQALADIARLPPSYLEEIERLEQLTPLMAQIPIYAYPIDEAPLGIDTLADLERARLYLRNRSH